MARAEAAGDGTPSVRPLARLASLPWEQTTCSRPRYFGPNGQDGLVKIGRTSRAAVPPTAGVFLHCHNGFKRRTIIRGVEWSLNVC